MKSFWRDQRGNVALIFGIAVIPLVLGVGVAVDYSRAANAHGHLQDIADAAALAGARENSDNLNEVTEVARTYFDAHLPPQFLSEIKNFNVSFTEEKAVRVEVEGTIETTFTGVVGIEQMGVKVASEVVRGVKGTLEVVFVLDNTASMTENDKIGTLKKVTRKIVDEVTKYKNVKAKFGLVPFSTYVNVGLSRRYEPWIDVPADSSVPKRVCYTKYRKEKKTSCVKKTGTCNNDGILYACSWEDCQWEREDPYEYCEDRVEKYVWTGCVGSRSYPLNVRDDTYSTRVPGLMNTSCAAQIQPLTDHPGTVKSAIAKMVATGFTYIPGGLVWGWRMLSPEAPLTEGAAFDPENTDPRKIIVLLTDGENTLKPTFPYHEKSSNVAVSDGYVSEICENAKGQNIEIFTIAFDVSDVGIKNVLQGCASSESHYFDAGNEVALEKAFEELAASFLDLRISR